MLDQNASTPLYEQLKNAIRKEIDEKKYSSGDRMPSEAELEKLYYHSIQSVPAKK